jgi:ABC-type transport system involved in cytochrome c biogenesis permease subunit
MKRFFPALAVLLGVLWIAMSLFPPKRPKDDVDFVRFGKIPVQVGGRVKPLDTVARNSLLIIHTKQTLRLSDGRQISAIKWLADTLFKPQLADGYPAFVIENSDVLGLFGWQQADRKHFSFAELTPFLKQIEEQGEQAEKLQAVERSAYQSGILNLRNSLVLYQRLKNSVQPEGAENFSAELQVFERAIPEGAKAARARETGDRFDQAQLDRVADLIQRYEKSAELAYVLAMPPRAGSGDWRSIGQTLTQSISARELDPLVKLYASLGDAYRSDDRAAFNADVHLLANRIAQAQPIGTQRARYEYFFNRFDPFTHSMTLYVVAFLLACLSWLGCSRPLNRAAFYLLLLALALHTFGLVSRMYLQERPPVTNLYSSAIFIGWGAVIVALILERIFRDGIGAACAGAVGFVTLVIAHHLAGSGDTLEMLQAVLDTNIWLATHVVAITTGYSAMFLAGMLAIIYVIRGVLTRSLKPETATSLARMTYGVVCFATLFSFVGTVLGGIWADQSWGRFWGWDPKENGALLIVLWCAIILHARWGEYIGQRGLMVMAIFGNVITSFSWFGVNMLGIGLHSYGFMQKAFPWLVGFMLSQLALMAIAAIPLNHWRSFQTSADSLHSTGEPEGFEFTPPKLAVETTPE